MPSVYTGSKRALMRNRLLLIPFTAISTIAFAQSAANVGSGDEEGGARERLIGTWRLMSAGTLSADGKFQPFPDYGAHPAGYLMYDTTGDMCAALANPTHPHWADPKKPTDAEELRFFDVFFACCGTYEVREKKNPVIHRPEVRSWPPYIKTDHSRNDRLEGDRLILSGAETQPGGVQRSYQITWERVTGNK